MDAVGRHGGRGAEEREGDERGREQPPVHEPGRDHDRRERRRSERRDVLVPESERPRDDCEQRPEGTE